MTSLETHGLVLGIEGDQHYDEVRATLATGDAVVLYTDGVIEARGAGELYGTERLDRALAERVALPPASWRAPCSMTVGCLRRASLPMIARSSSFVACDRAAPARGLVRPRRSSRGLGTRPREHSRSVRARGRARVRHARVRRAPGGGRNRRRRARQAPGSRAENRDARRGARLLRRAPSRCRPTGRPQAARPRVFRGRRIAAPRRLRAVMGELVRRWLAPAAGAGRPGAPTFLHAAARPARNLEASGACSGRRGALASLGSSLPPGWRRCSSDPAP